MNSTYTDRRGDKWEIYKDHVGNRSKLPWIKRNTAMKDESDKAHGGTIPPRLIHDDRNLLFAQRYGDRQPPDAMDYNLCKQFRDSLGRTITGIIERDLCDGIVDYKLLRQWRDLFSRFQTEVRDKKFFEVPPIKDADRVMCFVCDVVYNSDYLEVLSLCELLFEMLCKRNPGLMDQHDSKYEESENYKRDAESQRRQGSLAESKRSNEPTGGSDATVTGSRVFRSEIRHNYEDLQCILEVFKKGLAPYAVDTSSAPYRIVPVGIPEQGDAVVQSLADLHQQGYANAHRLFREAAQQINRRDHSAAFVSSFKALESVCRKIVGNGKGKQNFADAINKLKRQGFFAGYRSELVSALHQWWGYASATERHGQPDPRPSIDQNEAVLVFCLCANLAGFLSRLAGCGASSLWPRAPRR